MSKMTVWERTGADPPAVFPADAEAEPAIPSIATTSTVTNSVVRKRAVMNSSRFVNGYLSQAFSLVLGAMKNGVGARAAQAPGGNSR